MTTAPDYRVILASASPRRRDILTALGVPFEVCVSEADEACVERDAGRRVEMIAQRKCEAVRDCRPADERELILASDTLVVVDDDVFLGKPADKNEAARMLGMLSGRVHRVVSGIAVWYKGRMVTSHDTTYVLFCPMTDDDIREYIATGEPFGKAGGYAIQGEAAKYVAEIKGEYNNVVGLPVRCLYETVLREFGIRLFDCPQTLD